MLTNARVLWEGVGDITAGTPAPYCRVVLGTKEGNPQVVYEEATDMDALGNPVYELFAREFIPVVFFLAMDERTKLHSSRLNTVEREPR